VKNLSNKIKSLEKINFKLKSLNDVKTSMIKRCCERSHRKELKSLHVLEKSLGLSQRDGNKFLEISSQAKSVDSSAIQQEIKIPSTINKIYKFSEKIPNTIELHSEERKKKGDSESMRRIFQKKFHLLNKLNSFSLPINSELPYININSTKNHERDIWPLINISPLKNEFIESKINQTPQKHQKRFNKN